MKSWRTTLCGVIGIVSGAVVASEFSPLVSKLAGCAAMIGNGLGLLFARDNAVSRKMAAEYRNGPPPPRQRLPIKFLLLLLLPSALTAQELRPLQIALWRESEQLFVCVPTVQLAGETLIFEWATVLGDWRPLTPPVPPDPDGFRNIAYCATGPVSDWPPMAFFRVTGTLAPPLR